MWCDKSFYLPRASLCTAWCFRAEVTYHLGVKQQSLTHYYCWNWRCTAMTQELSWMLSYSIYRCRIPINVYIFSELILFSNYRTCPESKSLYCVMFSSGSDVCLPYVLRATLVCMLLGYTSSIIRKQNQFWKYVNINGYSTPVNTIW
jgi:hypothetical protein